MTEPATSQNPMDLLVSDPTGQPPMCAAEEFGDLLNGWIGACAPVTFAVVQVYGERVDAKIVGWGLEHDGEVNVFGTGGGIYTGLSTPADVLPYFHFGSHITARIVPVPPAPPHPATDPA